MVAMAPTASSELLTVWQAYPGVGTTAASSRDTGSSGLLSDDNLIEGRFASAVSRLRGLGCRVGLLRREALLA